MVIFQSSVLCSLVAYIGHSAYFIQHLIIKKPNIGLNILKNRPQKQQKIRKCHKTANVWHVFFLGGAGYCSQSTFCSVSPCPHVFLRRVGSLNLSPHLWENFSPKFGKTPNFSPISVTNSSPKLVNPQICPQILGQIRPQIW